MRFFSLLRVTEGNPDLATAQYDAFAKQIPLLYVTLLVNSWGLAYSFIASAPIALVIVAPILLTIVSAARISFWVRAFKTVATPEIAFRALRRTNSISGVLAFLFATWALSLYRYGDAYAQGHVLFFMGITVVGCIFCLMHLRSAALRVMLTVNVMFVTFFATSGNAVFVAVSLNIVLVSVVMLTVLWVYYTGFVDLIDSRKALSRQKDETQVLSDENYRLANIDSLSGLPNRRLFFAKLEEAVSIARKGGDLTAVGIIDLDGFKAVNDGYGHAAGDNLLNAIGARLASLLSTDVLVARLGGDEFGIIVKHVADEGELEILGEQICSEIAKPVILPSGIMYTAASVGFALISATIDCKEDVFENADYALYDAKRGGKGKVALFTPAHREAIYHASRIERAFEHPNFDRELSVVFQPVMDIQQGKVIAFEALARWNSASLGWVSPGAFIPAAERSGLISKMTSILLSKSLEVAKSWPPNVRLSFNLSAKDITSPARMARIMSLVSQSGFDPHRIDFELTETTALNDLEQASAAIAALQAMGIGVSLDDFGTGFSSLTLVHQLAVDTIKIDRSFVTDITTNPLSFKIVRSLLTLSRDMNVECIVEGVETEATLDVLRSLGCKLVQGFFFSKPMPASAITDYLEGVEKMVPGVRLDYAS